MEPRETCARRMIINWTWNRSLRDLREYRGRLWDAWGFVWLCPLGEKEESTGV